jgi:hypothetical protein
VTDCIPLGYSFALNTTYRSYVVDVEASDDSNDVVVTPLLLLENGNDDGALLPACKDGIGLLVTLDVALVDVDAVAVVVVYSTFVGIGTCVDGKRYAINSLVLTGCT